MTLDPAISWWLRGALALLFGVASAHKLRDLRSFRSVLENYRLLPAASIRIVTVLMPGIEACVAIGLLVPTTAQAAALAGATLLLVYAGAIAINLYAGRRDLDCGCLGVAGRASLSSALVVRNLLLAALAGIAQWPINARTIVWIDVFTITAGVATMALLYAAIDALIGNAPRLQSLLTSHAQGPTPNEG